MKLNYRMIALFMNRKRIINPKFSYNFLSSSSYESNNFRNNNSKRYILYSSIGISGLAYLFYKLNKENRFYAGDCLRLINILPNVQAKTEKTQHLLNNDNKVTPRIMYNFLADVAEKTSPSVVYIEIHARHPITQKSIPVSNGSGFIVKSDGLILTNAHVVSHYGHVTVKLFNGKEYQGTIEHIDSETDLATVRINAKDLPVLPLGQSSNLRPGEFVIAMGNPLTLSHTITAGVISSANRQGKDLGLHKKSDYIQTDAAVNVGNSGGPLVNLDGEAIGINTMKVTEGISFAIPSDRATEFLKRIENSKDKHVEVNKKKYLGITMLTLSPNILQELKERSPHFPDVSSGVMVWRVMIDSPAYICGIRGGDIITAINGKEIHSASDVYGLLQSEKVLKIHMFRNRRQFDVTVELLDPVLI